MTRLFISAILSIGLLAVSCNSNRARIASITQDDYAVMSVVIDSFYTKIYFDSERAAWVNLDSSTIFPPDRETGMHMKWPFRSLKPGVYNPDSADLSRDTSKEATLKGLQSDLPALDWQSLLSNFEAVNAQRVLLDSSRFSIRWPILFVSPYNIETAEVKAKLFHLPSGSHGGRRARFSRVAFNQTHDQALVYYCEEGAGFESMYFALHKFGDRWTMIAGRGYGGI